MPYDITRQFELTLLGLLQHNRNILNLSAVVLNGASGSQGGSGTPPGGFVGQLAQRYVAFDTTEAASSGSIGGSGSISSLVDNLNRIRANVFVFNNSEGYPADVSNSFAYGTSNYGSRRDHVHRLLVGSGLSWVSGSLVSSGGSGSGVSFNDAEGYPANIASASAYGVSAYASRRDHVHTVPLGSGMSWTSGSLTSTGGPHNIISSTHPDTTGVAFENAVLTYHSGYWTSGSPTYRQVVMETGVLPPNPILNSAGDDWVYSAPMT